MKESLEFIKLGPPERCRVIQCHAAPGLDFRPLQEWGTTLIPLYSGVHSFIHPDDSDWRRSSGQMDQALSLLKIAKFHPRLDYVALGGDILRNVTLCALIAKVWGSFCALRYDNKEGRYYSFMIDLLGVSVLDLQRVKDSPND